MIKKIAIIGGGAAGMMAAAAVKEFAPEVEVSLFEKNPILGTKVSISGGGRCNVTTGVFDVRKLLQNYPRGAKFLMSAMFRFPPDEVMKWFESHGVPLKIEDDFRVFPKSNVGKDIVGALHKTLVFDDVHMFLKTDVIGVEKVSRFVEGLEQDSFQLNFKNGENALFDALILTTGGNAYRHTGSTGDGYSFAKALGHSITPLAPSLSSFVVSEPWMRLVAGVSFENIRFTLMGKVKYERTGPFVFTHYGLSGPAIFALSSMAAYETFSKEKPLKLFVDLFPDVSSEMLLSKVNILTQSMGRKSVANFIDVFLPKSLCPIAVRHIDASDTLQAAQLSKEQRRKLVQFLKQCEFSVVGRAAGEEFVTAGGVSLDEVNTNTMESKVCPNLYFAGEILDIDGFTGGFNLQASWATGRLAGESVAQKC